MPKYKEIIIDMGKSSDDIWTYRLVGNELSYFKLHEIKVSDTESKIMFLEKVRDALEIYNPEVVIA